MAQRNNLPHALAKQARLFQGLVYCWHALFFLVLGVFIDQSKGCSNYPEPVECRIKFILGQNSTTKKSDSLSRLDARCDKMQLRQRQLLLAQPELPLLVACIESAC